MEATKGAGDTVAEVIGEAPGRNPNWTRDELILALELYSRHPSPGQHHPEVVQLSRELGAMWKARLGQLDGSVRNPNGVSMKLANYQRTPRSMRGGELAWREVDVWRRRSGRPSTMTLNVCVRLLPRSAP